MPWECCRCGARNGESLENCEKCQLDKGTAVTMVVAKRKRMCEECGHIHKEDTYCHCFAEAADGDIDMADEDIESEEDSSDDDSTMLSLGLSQVSAKAVKLKPLSTPAYARAAHYIRCNCLVGVPSESRRYEAVSVRVMVGDIRIQTYAEIVDPSERTKYLAAIEAKNTPAQKKLLLERRNVKFAENIPHILSFLPIGLCSQAPKVNTYWNFGTNLYTRYIDMRNCVPWMAYRAHQNQVDTLVITASKVYSGGDKRVRASDFTTGEILSEVTRDSGDVSKLTLLGNELFACSTNGSIRTFLLTHTGKNIKMNATMWDHTRTISDILIATPSKGACEMHGMNNHICTIYTASEDRSIKVWNLVTYHSIKAISSKNLKTASFTCLAQSDRHLFAGTTVGLIAVFSKFNVCEREDIHLCNAPGMDKSYCLQVSVRLPKVRMDSGAPAAVTSILCTGYNKYRMDSAEESKTNDETIFIYTNLWASDSSGQLSIWIVPTEEIDYVPVHTVKAHKGSINDMKNTLYNVITIGDDGFVLIFDAVKFAKVRTINIMEWCNYRSIIEKPNLPRKIKSLNIHEDYVNGGSLAVGTSYGDIIVFSIGTTV